MPETFLKLDTIVGVFSVSFLKHFKAPFVLSNSKQLLLKLQMDKQDVDEEHVSCNVLGIYHA